MRRRFSWPELGFSGSPSVLLLPRLTALEGLAAHLLKDLVTAGKRPFRFEIWETASRQTTLSRIMDGLMETTQADRTEPGLADRGEGPRDLFGRGVRLVVSYIRMHPRPFAIAVFGAFLYAIGSVAVTVALGRVTDRVLRPAFTPEGVDASTVWLGIGAVMGLTALRAIGIGIRRYYGGVTGAAVAATLRERVSDRYRDLALSYHRTRPTGELLAHM